MACVTLALLFVSAQSEGSRRSIGTVTFVDASGDKFWGMKADFNILSPFAPRLLRFSVLEERFRKEGLRLICRYEVTDVIGRGAWSVVIAPTGCSPH